MLDWLINVDKELFHFVNSTMSNPFFDSLMPFLRDKYTWLPFYLLLIVLIIRRYGWKSIWVLGLAILAVAFADILSAKVLKPMVARLRPCHSLADVRLLLDSCGGKYSFVSSHATNHFALAFFFISIFQKPSNKQIVTFFFLLWAALISFAQVYVGVHFPFDVLCGAALGSLIGYGLGWANIYLQCHRSGKLI